MVAFQTAYNYLDLLTEQLGPDPAANARRLHEALLVALDPAAAHLDYYEYNAQHDDDGRKLSASCNYDITGGPIQARWWSITAYADVMRWEAQQRGAPLFDRLALMRYWNEGGLFDLYSTTKDYAMARKVHDCIGQVLASQIVDASHLDVLKLQTKR